MAIPYQKRKPKSSKTLKNKMFADFSEGLYLLDTPRDILEQLGSLALKGGVNVYPEKGSLIHQYGYAVMDKIPEDEVIIGISKDSLSATSFYIVTLLGNVYLYTAAQGLKKFKTTIGDFQLDKNMLLARKNNDLIMYVAGQCMFFGNFYRDGDEFVTIDTNAQVSNYNEFIEAIVSVDNVDYYWNNKKVAIKQNNKEEIHAYNITNMRYITEVTPEGTSTKLVLTMVWEDFTVEPPDIQGLCSIGEKTMLQTDLIYRPEESSEVERVLHPKLLEVCNNRLCVVDYSGYIYYSQVGIFTQEESGLTEAGFNEAYGAGYFGGFYNDSSEVLSIEEYKTGALITKKNGMYYLTISDTTSSSSVSLESTIGINIVKVSDIGQEYATDHVIVEDKVYAYDYNSASIVLACQQTIYGTVVPGSTLIPAEFLNAQQFGIQDTKRCLVYNKDSQVFILYYGEDLKHGIVLNNTGNLFPRELDRSFIKFQGFNQSVFGVSEDNLIVQDFKRGTIIPNIQPVAEFEAIGLKDNRCICASILELTELNGIECDVNITNTLTSYQHILPYTNIGVDKLVLPPMLYSNQLTKYSAYGLTPEEEKLIAQGKITEEEIFKTKGLNKWAAKKSNCTRIYAPMSGREGIAITIQFPTNVAFCLAGIRIPDFSQGE